jgi:hypothetical protein
MRNLVIPTVSLNQLAAELVRLFHLEIRLSAVRSTESSTGTVVISFMRLVI